MVGGVGLLGIVGLGAVGGILANIALTPLTAGASLLQSYWYGSGLILGERMMYTVHWEQIKGRLDKGEDFLQVLDKIMNDDITAIANLSFKAMDETGKLYLDKAGESIANLVEKLLLAILGSPVTITTEPPPGEETSEGISHTVGELELMTLQQLTSIINNANLYTETTVAFAKTVKAQKLLDEQSQQEEKEDISALRSAFRLTETAFLQILTTVTLAGFWTPYITSFDDASQTRLVASLRQFGYSVGYNTLRTKSDASDLILTQLRTSLSVVRNAFILDPTEAKQIKINEIHVIIWFHQLIYSR